MVLCSRDRKEKGRIDLESVEMHIRASMHEAGRNMLEQLLNAQNGYAGRTISCGNSHDFEFVGYREKRLLTVLGEVTIKRAYYHDKDCGRGFCPKDRELSIEGSSSTPGVRRMIGRVGAMRPFALGEEDMKELAGLTVNSKEIERISHELGEDVEEFLGKESALQEEVVPAQDIVPKLYVCMDGTGVPVVGKETVNRQGKGEEGRARTRETKLGCVFTQTGVDNSGFPVRDEESTSYAGAIETAEEFSGRIYKEAKRRGLDGAKEVCVIGDGAPWIWNIANEQFYGSTQIVDLYHAREHYWSVGRMLLGKDKETLNSWTKERKKDLDNGKVEEVIAAIMELVPTTEDEKAVQEREIGYFEKNKERMRYDKFREKGLFVGSGVLEAGCRSVIGQRLKQSGMHWTVKGANSIIALRTCILSNRWEDFWEHKAAA